MGDRIPFAYNLLPVSIGHLGMCSQWILEVQLLRFVGTSSLVPMSMLFERDHNKISTSVEVEDVTSDLEIDDFDVKSKVK